MKEWKTIQIVLFTAVCILLNMGGRFLAAEMQLPLWLDSFGTVLIAYVGGPICGAAVGAASNLMYGAVNRLSAIYSLTSVAIGVITGIAARKKLLNSFYGAMIAASLAVLVAAPISILLNMVLSGGDTGNIWGNAVIDYLLDMGWAPGICYCLGQIAVDFADKVLTIMALYLVVRIFAWRSARKNASAPPSAAAGALIVALALGFSLGAGQPARAEADRNAEVVDYNDYVQTVYNSNNGLPCGEANDIVQTNDGVLWVGTYAGLYRYNGHEFHWIDDFESVHNVNCLYVDKEGRMWIGTNDNGLSIVIREKVTNVLDQSLGLSSDSVRCITQAADGLYYVGTTGSLQILTINNGLKIANTLREINYADNIASDEDGHVAVITADGRLFLLQGGKILSSLQAASGTEFFNCCAFAPDGKLLAGTSTNHIYHYDILNGGFELVDTASCPDATTINNLHFLADGTLFISADSGISYLHADGSYRQVNTNAFDNSIDHMLVDYQGNLWFTSSRLGLLRLARSAFKDVYGTIGMPRQVVNTVTRWQGNYYFGTDKGLDVVDDACRAEAASELIALLSGQRIRCMDVSPDDHLWICTYGNGLLEVAPGGETWWYDEKNGGFGNRARLVTDLSDGTVLVAGDTGLSFIRDHQVEHTVRYEDGLTNPMILTVAERDDGSILAGTDGDGIAVIRDGKVVDVLTRADGLSSGVILRMVQDPKSEGVFVVTSNGLCYLGPEGAIRPLENFPYFNNYDIWARDADTLFVMSSAGIYVVGRDALVADEENMPCELLDARMGLTSAITANSWNYYDGQGDLFLPCDTGVYVIDVERYNNDVRSYRMQLVSIKVDNVPLVLPQANTIAVDQGVTRIELHPEILNYSIQKPCAGYYLEGFDTQWTILAQDNLGSIVYSHLPAGSYTFHLGVFDRNGEELLEEQSFALVKEGELYERPVFKAYLLLILITFIVWIIWLLVQRQLRKQQYKLDMANETVLAIANAVDAKDVRTSQHSTRVAEYSVLIAREMGCFKWWQRSKKLANLKRAAQMHDIGKIGIHDAVLNKVGRLTDEEYSEMKSHVVRGADILKDFTLVENVVEGARFHHERYDGRGYPDGLKGKEIPLYGRIIAVADAFDAMTSNRVYRNQMDTDYVMKEMVRGRGAQFDPDALDAFLRLVDKGVINLKDIYTQRNAEIIDQTTQEAVAKRAEEDKQIQAAAIRAEKQAAKSTGKEA